MIMKIVRSIDKLDTETVAIWAILCLFLVLLSSLADFASQLYPESCFGTIIALIKLPGSVANSVAVAVSIFGLLTIPKKVAKIERQLRNITTPLFVDAATEDSELVEQMREHLNIEESQIQYLKKNLQEVFNNCPIDKDKPDIQGVCDWLDQLSGSIVTIPKNKPIVDLDLISNHAIRHKTIIVLYYNEGLEKWFEGRMMFYTKLNVVYQKQGINILSKIIVCTNRRSDELKLPKGVKLLSSEYFDCQKLISKIEEI